MPWTDQQIDKFFDYCIRNLHRKSDCFERNFISLNEVDAIELTQETGIIQFSRRGFLEIEARFIPIGVYLHSSEIWMWAWANKSILPELSKPSLAIKRLSEATGISIFNEEGFKAGEREIHEMSAVGCEILGGAGACMCEEKDHNIYVALFDISLNNAKNEYNTTNEDEILARELGKLGALGGFTPGGGAGASFAAKFLPNDVFEIIVEIGDTLSNVRWAMLDILNREGNLSVECNTSDPGTICATVGSGFLNLNPTFVKVKFDSVSVNKTKTTISGIAKEGLIKQKAGEKAAKKIATLLTQTFV